MVCGLVRSASADRRMCCCWYDDFNLHPCMCDLETDYSLYFLAYVRCAHVSARVHDVPATRLTRHGSQDTACASHTHRRTAAALHLACLVAADGHGFTRAPPTQPSNAWHHPCPRSPFRIRSTSHVQRHLLTRLERPCRAPANTEPKARKNPRGVAVRVAIGRGTARRASTGFTSGYTRFQRGCDGEASRRQHSCQWWVAAGRLRSAAAGEPRAGLG